MAGWGKLALTLAVAGILAIAAAGCGGGGSTTAAGGATGADATTAEAGATTTDGDAGTGRNEDGSAGGGSGEQSGGSGPGGGDDGGSSGGNGSGSSGQGNGSGGGGSGSGSGGSGSDEFTVPGGDNSVQEFGGEASAAERAQASSTLQAYMKARAGEDHQTVCASLSKAAVKQLRDLAEAVGGVGPGDSCVAIFTAIDKQTPASARENTMTGPISSLRVEGDRAFALYHGTRNTDYTIPMEREGGSWKVGALVPFPLTAAS